MTGRENGKLNNISVLWLLQSLGIFFFLTPAKTSFVLCCTYVSWVCCCSCILGLSGFIPLHKVSQEASAGKSATHRNDAQFHELIKLMQTRRLAVPGLSLTIFPQWLPNELVAASNASWVSDHESLQEGTGVRICFAPVFLARSNLPGTMAMSSWGGIC